MTLSRSCTCEPLESRRLFAVTYTLVELNFQPTDLNNLGQITGGNAVYQLRHQTLTQTTLSTLASGTTLTVRRINDEGIILGTEASLAGEEVLHQQVILGKNRKGQYASRYVFDHTTPAVDQLNTPSVISNSGQILTDGGENSSASLGKEYLIQLGARGKQSAVRINDLSPADQTLLVDTPKAINDTNQFLATDVNSSIDDFAYLDHGRLRLISAQQFNNGLSSPSQRLNDLNDVDQIVGATQLANAADSVATLYMRSRNGAYYRTLLGTLPHDDVSTATQINNAGQILGISYSTPLSGPILDQNAFIASKSSRGKYSPPVDLNTLIENPGNDRVTRPIAINDAGVIIAEGLSTRNGSQRFLLLLPSKANTPNPAVQITRTTSHTLSTPALPAISISQPMSNLFPQPLVASRAVTDDPLW